jgi:hypothetical protein
MNTLQKTIKLTFEWDGKTVHKEASGFEGAGCLTQTEFIDKALGTVVSKEMKQEFYVPEPAMIDQRAQVHI